MPVPVTNPVYLAVIQERLVNEYRFPPHATYLDVNERYNNVPDGDYPMVFRGALHLMRVEDGMPLLVGHDRIQIRLRPHMMPDAAWGDLLDCCRKNGEPMYMVKFDQTDPTLWPVVDRGVDPVGDYEFQMRLRF